VAFRKGHSGNPAGRKRGSQNVVTRSLKEAMLATFSVLGGQTHLLGWAKKHPGDFYRIFARMTPPGLPVRIEGLEGSLADQGRTVLAKLAAGEITPEQAATIMQSITALMRIIVVDELEHRIAALEARQRRQ